MQNHTTFHIQHDGYPLSQRKPIIPIHSLCNCRNLFLEKKTRWNTDQEKFASVVKRIRNQLSRRNQKKDLLSEKIEDTRKRRNLITLYEILKYKVKLNSPMTQINSSKITNNLKNPFFSKLLSPPTRPKLLFLLAI